MVQAISDFGIFNWNISAKVGLKSPNNADDVALVKWGYVCLMANPKNASSPVVKDSEMRVLVGRLASDYGGCSGREDDLLVKVIRRHEKITGRPYDGYVSPTAPNSGGRYRPGADGSSNAFIVHSLLNSINDATTGQVKWPRLQDHPSCPSVLRVSMEKACTL